MLSISKADDVKIVVTVKQVAALDDDLEILADGSDLDPADLEWDLNEWDTFSLEAALQLREAEDADGEIVVVTVGDEMAEEGLLAALAKGADRAVRVWDDRLNADPLSIARVLAAAVHGEQPDLVLCGVQSSDAVNSATGIALAGFLKLPHVAVVKGIERDGQRLIIERELEGGTIELLEIVMPALLTIQTGINEPRYATLRAIKQAQDKPLEVKSLTDLGLDSDEVKLAAGSQRRRLIMPEKGAGAEILDGSPAEVAAKIVALVKERMG